MRERKAVSRVGRVRNALKEGYFSGPMAQGGQVLINLSAGCQKYSAHWQSPRRGRARLLFGLSGDADAPEKGQPFSPL
jgi:hypothetical protein